MNSKLQFRMFTIVDLDKKEEYLHEMHLKGWKYRTSRFGLFYFDQCQPDDVIYRIYDSRFLKKYKHELQDFRNSGWEWIETGFCSILRKPASDLLTEDQVYMSKDLRWEVFLIFIIDWILLIVFAIQISYIFWKLSQKWKELSDK